MANSMVSQLKDTRKVLLIKDLKRAKSKGTIPGGTTCKKSVVNKLFTTLFFFYRMLPNAFPKEKIIETSSTSLTPGKNLSF